MDRICVKLIMQMIVKNKVGSPAVCSLNIPVTAFPCDTMPVGFEGTIQAIEGTEVERDRLIACGLRPGERVRIVRRGPFRGPYQLAVRNIHLALPRADASRILVHQ